MRRTEAERRRRAKNRAQRAKQRVLVLVPYLGYSALEQGHLLSTQVGTRGNEPEVRMRTTGHLTSVLLEHEGRTWVRGWFGEVPDAFRAQVALLAGTPSEPHEKFKITGRARHYTVISNPLA